MGLTPAFDPASGASGGAPPASPPAAADGSPKLLFDCDMTGDLDFTNTVGTVTLGGREWTTTTTADEAIADGDGTTVEMSSTLQYYLVTELPDVAAGDLICIAVDWEPLDGFTKSTQGIQLRLGQAAGETNTVYDLYLSLRRLSSNWRNWNAYRTGSNWTAAYVGINPWEPGGALPARCQMMVSGQGYTWRTSSANTTAAATYRGHAATANAAGSLRTRGGGQTVGDTLPHIRYVKLLLVPANDLLRIRIRRVVAWVGGRVV